MPHSYVGRRLAMIDLHEGVAEIFLDAQQFIADRVRAWACERGARATLSDAYDGWPKWNGVVYHTSDYAIIRPIAPIQDRYEKQRKGPLEARHEKSA
jgi:hypothetical protein